MEIRVAFVLTMMLYIPKTHLELKGRFCSCLLLLLRILVLEFWIRGNGVLQSEGIKSVGQGKRDRIPLKSKVDVERKAKDSIKKSNN
jgi:hypothetical protein